MAPTERSRHGPPNPNFSFAPMYANEPLFELNWRSVMADAIADRAAQRGERSTAPHSTGADGRRRRSPSALRSSDGLETLCGPGLSGGEPPHHSSAKL